MYANWVPASSPSQTPPVRYYNNFIPQPDVLLELDTTATTSRFWAHSQIICQYSGYLRSAVATALVGIQRTLYDTQSATTKPIFIPNVTVEQFEPLLRYMYTGFLDLTMDNIFGVLLATHVLHMPHALEICRSFLARMQAQGILPTTRDEEHSAALPTIIKPPVLKPIPKKPRQTANDCAITSPSCPTVLVQSSDSTFRRTLRMSRTDPADVSHRANHTEPPLSSNSQMTNRVCAAIGDKSHSATEMWPHTKAIVDIASCDGPVRFRRVVNKFYSTNSESRKGTEPDVSVQLHQLSSSSFHQQMARDINERRRCAEKTNYVTPSEDTDQQQNESFKCNACNHSFKSEYCYRKHSKRHLIPLIDQNGDPNDSSENAERFASQKLQDNNRTLRPKVKIQEVSASPLHIREVIRPLDMNVQYYPCKTCGSKFPSYYFVHKHRKLCHERRLSNSDVDSLSVNSSTSSVIVPATRDLTNASDKPNPEPGNE